jgi:ribosomal protein S27AE
MKRHEHYDHYDDLEKCERCGGTDLMFDPKLGNECDTCGYKKWEK